MFTRVLQTLGSLLRYQTDPYLDRHVGDRLSPPSTPRRMTPLTQRLLILINHVIINSNVKGA